MSRHQSPFATAGPKRTHFAKSFPPGLLIPEPCATVMRYTPTFTAISVHVTNGCSVVLATERIDTVPRRFARMRPRAADAPPTRTFPCVAWSGQRGPTGVIRRHSVQIGRSHSVHERP